MAETIETNFARYVYQDVRWWYADDAGEPVPDTVRNIDDETVVFLTALSTRGEPMNTEGVEKDVVVVVNGVRYRRVNSLWGFADPPHIPVHGIIALFLEQLATEIVALDECRAERDSLQRVHDAAQELNEDLWTNTEYGHDALSCFNEGSAKLKAELTRHAAEHGGD